MADYASAETALLAAIDRKAQVLLQDNWEPQAAALLLLQLAQAYAPIRAK